MLVEAVAVAALSVAPSPWRAGDADTMAVVVAEAGALLTAVLHAGDASVTAVVAAVATATEVAAMVAVAQAAAPQDASAIAWFATVVALVLRMVVVATTSGTGAEERTWTLWAAAEEVVEEAMEKATEVKLVVVGVAAVATRAVDQAAGSIRASLFYPEICMCCSYRRMHSGGTSQRLRA